MSWRQKIIFPILTLAILFLAGCAPSPQWVWQHPAGYGDQELRAALAECDKIAWDEVNRSYYAPPWPIYLPAYSDRFFYRRNYYYYYDDPFYKSPSQLRHQDQQRFFRICMEAKGWQRVALLPSRQP